MTDPLNKQVNAISSHIFMRTELMTDRAMLVLNSWLEALGAHGIVTNVADYLATICYSKCSMSYPNNYMRFSRETRVKSNSKVDMVEVSAYNLGRG